MNNDQKITMLILVVTVLIQSVTLVRLALKNNEQDKLMLQLLDGQLFILNRMKDNGRN